MRVSPALPPGNAAAAARALTQIGQGFLALAQIVQGKPALLAPAPLLLPAPDKTVIETMREFLFAKARAGCSDRYLRQLRVSLGSFASGRNKVPLVSITTADVERWVNDHDWAPKTARGYVSDLRTLFNFAVRRGYIERNPAAGVVLPVQNGGGAIHVHTPDQVKQVLATARKANLDVCRLLAVRYFAGLRSAEAHRIRESDIKLDQGLIEVSASKSKTRSRRLVTIQPNLRAWLALGGELRAVGDMTIRHVIRLSKVKWEHNVTRHSFVSYHLAKFENAGKTALEAGHTEQMLFKHYRALVTPAAAAEFWEIKP